MLLAIFIGFALLSFIVSSRLKSKFNKYSQVGLSMSGAEVAKRMLENNGIYDVTIRPVEGSLTDHYNPTDKTVNLSHDVYYGRSVSAAAVAAHETGHAIQHATAYSWLQLRTALVPLQNVSAKILNVIFIVMFAGAFLLPNLMPMTLALQIIVAAYAVFALFAVVTLPVEINASQRAIAWLTGSGIIVGETREQARDALKWAAYTYVVAALSAIATLLYYVMMLVGRNDD